MKRSAKKDGDEPGFDARLERLESLVQELEAGGLGLEPAISKYQEGIGELKDCHQLLAGYRKRVEELAQDAEGILRPFEGDPDFAADGDSTAAGQE